MPVKAKLGKIIIIYGFRTVEITGLGGWGAGIEEDKPFHVLGTDYKRQQYKKHASQEPPPRTCEAGSGGKEDTSFQSVHPSHPEH